MTKTAILLGATGLVGSELLQQLLKSDAYSEIKVFVRRSTGINHAKLTESIVDFNRMEDWRDSIKGSDLFIAFGTTIKKAGSQDNQYKIDVTYPFEVAKAAAHNGVKSVFLVSAMGANSNSKIFYSRMKGELDDKIKALPFERIHLYKPSLLVGTRTEFRLGEYFSYPILSILFIIPFLRKYRPIKASIVARAMINTSLSNENKDCFELDEIFKRAKKIPQQ